MRVSEGKIAALAEIAKAYEAARAACDRKGLGRLEARLVAGLKRLIGPERPVKLIGNAYWYSAGKSPDLYRRAPAWPCDEVLEIAPDKPGHGDLLDRNEIAEILDISASAVSWHLIRCSACPEKIEGQTKLYSPEAVELIRSQLRPHRKPKPARSSNLDGLLSIRQIADLGGLNPNAIRSRIRRSRMKAAALCPKDRSYYFRPEQAKALIGRGAPL